MKFQVQKMAFRNKEVPPEDDLLENFHKPKIGQILHTSRNQPQNIFASYRPKKGHCVDYKISQTYAKLDGGDTKINLRNTEASYIYNENPPSHHSSQIIYSHGGPPQWEFIDERWRRKQDALQIRYRKELKHFMRRMKIETKRKQNKVHRLILSTGGPDWFMELSPKQLLAVEQLKLSIEKDIRDKTTTNVKDNISILGLVRRPNDKHIQKALEDCNTCPIEFLLILYQLINPKRKCYSLNDRLLLSGVAHLTISDTLRELHVRIPSPPREEKKPKPKPLKKKRVKWDSPYLEPFTFRPEPKKFTGIYYDKHLQYPTSPYFSYLNKLRMDRETYRQRYASEEDKKSAISGVEKDISDEVKDAQKKYQLMFNNCTTKPLLLPPSVYKTCTGKYSNQEYAADNTPSAMLPKKFPWPLSLEYDYGCSPRCSKKCQCCMSTDKERDQSKIKGMSLVDALQIDTQTEGGTERKLIEEPAADHTQHKDKPSEEVKNTTNEEDQIAKRSSDNREKMPSKCPVDNTEKQFEKCAIQEQPPKNKSVDYQENKANREVESQENQKRKLPEIEKNEANRPDAVPEDEVNSESKKFPQGKCTCPELEPFAGKKQKRIETEQIEDPKKTHAIPEFEPPHQSCKCKTELDVFMSNKCNCKKCQQLHPTGGIRLMSSSKQTDSGHLLPVIGGIHQKTCDCLLKHQEKIRCYEDYVMRIKARQNLRSQPDKYIIGGVVRKPEGPVYIISGMRPAIQCKCGENLRKQQEEERRLAKMPEPIKGRIQYVVSGVKQTPEPDRNIFILSGAIPKEECNCMKLFKKFEEKHSRCLKAYEDYLQKITEETNKYEKGSNHSQEVSNKDIGDETEGSTDSVDSDEDVDTIGDDNVENAVKSNEKEPLIETPKQINPESNIEEPTTESPREVVKEKRYKKEDEEIDRRKFDTVCPATGRNSMEFICTCIEDDIIESSPKNYYSTKDVAISKVCECKKKTANVQTINEFKRYRIFEKIPTERKEQIPLIKSVLETLAEDGYPLAKLPEAYKLPHFKLWIDMRCAKTWSYLDKEEYMTKSKILWRHTELRCKREIPLPKLKISREKATQLTWANAKYVRGLVGEQVDKYYRKCRQNSVDTGREWFPTTYSYEFPNSTFRDCFFAYTSSKEDSVIAVDVWKVHEMKQFLTRRCV